MNAILTIKKYNLEAMQQGQGWEERVDMDVEGVPPLHIRPILIAAEVLVAHVPLN